MPEITDSVLATLSQAQRRVEVASQNLANAATPSYKRKIAFSSLVRSEQSGADIPQVNIALDNRPGKLTVTGNPADLAIAGEGYFAFGSESGVIYSRQGQLTVNDEGRLVNAQGFALQLANGNDLIVKSSAFEVREDGTVTEKGELLGKVAVYAALSDDPAAAAVFGNRSSQADFALLPTGTVRQGAIEASNVTSGDEMVSMMEALRRAEAGQRLMSIYDDLMGRVITSFGEAAR
jgi:flagellar basal-body rod protein FlgF